MESEEDLLEYEIRLEDRFGAIPDEVGDLLNTMKLRWLAAQVGMERLILKQGKAIGYFVSDRESKFYQSATFTKILSYIQEHAQDTVLKEDRNKLVLVIERVASVNDAIDKLSGLLSKESESITQAQE